ncbi:uncharacterized protein LY79DRAFT_567478 [Colletotrichum navitas]|uniref:Clr5 domain-containing protein n=1 Tax=Colletotrichum navitas TaxID=681940 RepID=A0AAD8PQD3_9PEZI|nr:uncharacterized protein LY79DRAFT_567478 [Colletotrichum navitas]KAK1573845.1 hypothetical protein LY79DRAFT_567478 [Colletotrichum navitas]
MVPNTEENVPLDDFISNGNRDMPTLSDGPSNNFEPIISPRAAVLLAQDLSLRPAPTSFTSSHGPSPLISMPAATNRTPLQRPEGQEHWEAKKETIRALYLDDGMPLKDLMHIMSTKHSFSATERMYKRQFLKWNWRKYNTKGRQQSQVGTEHRGARYEKPTRRRQAERSMINLANQAQNPIERGHMYRRDADVSTPLLFSNRNHRQMEELHFSLRDLIYGSAQQSSAWKGCSKFELLGAQNDGLVLQFELAFEFLKEKELHKFGAALRRAFHTAEVFLEKEGCEILQPAILDVPFDLLSKGEINELQIFLYHVFRMLTAKKPGEPIQRMAKAMYAILLDSPDLFAHSLRQLYGITAHYFSETRGLDDLASLNARTDLIQIKKRDKTLHPKEAGDILRDYRNLLHKASTFFGQDSQETIEAEAHYLWTAFCADCWDNYENICKGRIHRIRAENEANWDTWDYQDLDNLARCTWYLSSFYEKVGDVSSRIQCLAERLQILGHVSRRDGNTRGSEARVTECRIELAKVLKEAGQVEEALELKLDIVRSGYFEEVTDDPECNDQS